MTGERKVFFNDKICKVIFCSIVTLIFVVTVTVMSIDVYNDKRIRYEHEKLLYQQSKNECFYSDENKMSQCANECSGGVEFLIKARSNFIKLLKQEWFFTTFSSYLDSRQLLHKFAKNQQFPRLN